MMKSWYRRAVLVYWQVGTRNGTLRLVPPRLHLPATLWNSSAASLSEHALMMASYGPGCSRTFLTLAPWLVHQRARGIARAVTD